MKVSNISNIQFPNFIIVRNYNNSIVNVPSHFRIKEENAVGCWRNKIKELVPMEYKQEILWQDQAKEKQNESNTTQV